MIIKVIEHGHDGYQLQRLDPAGRIMNVRPATLEEFRLYEKAKTADKSSVVNYDAKMAAVESLKKMREAWDTLQDQVTESRRAAEIARDREKAAIAEQDRMEKEIEELEHDVVQLRIDCKQLRADLASERDRAGDLESLLLELKQADNG